MARADAAVDLPEITEATRLTLRPGDALAIHLARLPNADDAHEIADRVRAVLGMNVPVLVFGPGEDVKVVEAPQPDGA